MATDKTNYAQSLMHMIKGNLGTGILAMPASFAHTGIVSACIGLPLLCLISTYCIHLLVRSSRQLEAKFKGLDLKYASLAKHSFKCGPRWMRASSRSMCVLVDGILLISQIGVCCVYLVFVVDNITSILASYKIEADNKLIFLIIFPLTLLLSYIRTLKRLAIASAFANVLQAVGISIIVEYLIRGIDRVNLEERDNFRPLKDAALGFGSAMFAFEGISVVLPIYSRMQYPELMSGCSGVVNISYVVLLALYFIIGFFGYLKFGKNARDSITLNLPPEPLYDAVRAIFASSVFLTYPLQFYVPQEIIWNWTKKNILRVPETNLTVISALEVVVPNLKTSYKSKSGISGKTESCSKLKDFQANQIDTTVISSSIVDEQARLVKYEYLCRTLLVTLTFVLAMIVPKLNLLMDLIGSITGTALSLILPAIIHLASLWDDTKGIDKVTMIVIDVAIIAVGLLAGASGSYFSFRSIIDSFH